MTQIKEIKKIDILSILRNYITKKLQLMQQRKQTRRLNKILKKKLLTEYKQAVRTSTRNYIRRYESKFGENVYPLKCELLNMGIPIRRLEKISNNIMKEEADIYVLKNDPNKNSI